MRPVVDVEIEGVSDLAINQDFGLKSSERIWDGQQPRISSNHSNRTGWFQLPRVSSKVSLPSPLFPQQQVRNTFRLGKSTRDASGLARSRKTTCGGRHSLQINFIGIAKPFVTELNNDQACVRD
jgi:hypothetical protein